jgi:hypothetical protein
MKFLTKIILIICLLTTPALAQPPTGLNRATRNIHGGHNFYSNRGYQGRSSSNIFGGRDYYNRSGRMTYRSMPTSGGMRYSKTGR